MKYLWIGKKIIQSLVYVPIVLLQCLLLVLFLFFQSTYLPISMYCSYISIETKLSKYAQWPWTQLKMYESKSLFSSNRSHVVISSVESSHWVRNGKNCKKKSEIMFLRHTKINIFWKGFLHSLPGLWFFNQNFFFKLKRPKIQFF